MLRSGVCSLVNLKIFAMKLIILDRVQPDPGLDREGRPNVAGNPLT